MIHEIISTFLLHFYVTIFQENHNFEQKKLKQVIQKKLRAHLKPKN